MSVFFSATIMVGQTIGIHWGYPVNVGVGTTHNNIFPRLTLMDNDVPLVIWQDNSPAVIYSSNKMGSVFSSPVAINSGVAPYVVSWTGPEISSSGDTAFVVFMTPIGNPKTYSVRSIDGGMTFSDTVRIDNETGRIASFPTVAVMPGGNPVVSYMGSDTLSMSNPEHTVTRSVDGGLTYLPAVEPAVTGEACDCCPASLAISPTSQALLFRNNIGGLREIWASLSSDDCVSFPVSANIDTTNWFVSVCPSSSPSGVIIGDSLVYTWMSDGTSDARVYIGTMNVLDQQLGQHRQLYPIGLSTQNYPVIAGKGDTLGVVWLGYNAGAQEVLFTWSLTGAAGLGATVDTLTKGTSGHQSRPDLVFNNGKFHVVYSNSLGTQVQYLEGQIVQNVSVNEVQTLPEVSMTSFNNGHSLDLIIQSNEELKGTIYVLNSLGQELKGDAIILSQGENKHSISHQFTSGIYFLVFRADNGKSYQRKISLNK